MIARALVGLAFALALTAATPSDAQSWRSVKITESARLPQIRPDWPVPREANQVLYIQRSVNSNTVVYTAQFDASGNLKRRTPISVYWRRYDTNGARKPLKFIETQFAYGVNSRRTNDPAEFRISLKAVPQANFVLRQTGPGKAELLGQVGGRMVRLVYAYITVDDGGLVPNVVGVSLHGIDPGTGRAVSEAFRVSGAEITQ